jgi:putative acetyltransferase
LAKEMNIRAATLNDADPVRYVHLSAFPEGERDIVAGLAVDLLYEEAIPPILSLVSEIDDSVVGHVAFSPVKTFDTKQNVGYILAPLAVKPSYQKQGIASLLIEAGIAHLSALGPGILLVYGNPKFYSRYGFSAEHAGHYTPPYQLEHAFGWQGMVMRDYQSRSSSIDISCVSSLYNPALW